MIQSHLGHYAIESPLGSGGMGDVYRARDTRLGRSVAIKVLPEVFTGNIERVERFEREARVLASLNHPNIATLYGFEAFENVRFLVMELAEGQTLAERIARGPIPVDEAMKIARQIAEALEAAHEKGIIHRDLKPANIKVTMDGKVKVLDFGLAKAMESVPNSPMSNSPTLMSVAATNAGIILGTAAYMSPEQAKGLAADARSDIFSFGCVLYEMLTGGQPFQGDSVAEVMAGVIARPPEFTLLPANLNPRITELLQRCLEKDPRRRWQTVGGVRAEIDVMLADPHGLVIQPEVALRRPLWKRAIPALVGILAGGAIAGAAVWFLKPPPAKAVTRFVVAVPGFNFTGRRSIDISRDGTQLVYVPPNGLDLRPISDLNLISIQGLTVDARNPVFSPDGHSIVFWTQSDGTLKRIPTSGGASVTLCPADNVYGMSWGLDDEIVFGQGGKGIFRVSANAGKADLIVAARNGELLHGPQMLPGGQAILFTSAMGAIRDSATWDHGKTYVQRLPSGDRKLLIDGGSDARYVPTGHIIYALAGNLVAVPFDLETLSVTGRAVPVVERVQEAFQFGGTGTAQFSISDNGTLIYIPGDPVGSAASGGATNVSIVDFSGAGTPLGFPINEYVSARVSPDGKQLAVGTDNGREADIYVYDLSGKTSLRQLTFSGRNLYPVWSGDSKRILFQSDREKDVAIFWQLADGTGVAERLTKPESGASHIPESWLPREQKFSYLVLKGDQDIWVHSIDDKKDTPLIVIPGSNQHDSMFSPDGHWIAYRSEEPAKTGVYVEPYPTTGAKYLLGAKEPLAVSPVWSPEGKTVFFNLGGNSVIHSVGIQVQPTFTSTNTATLSVSRFRLIRGYRTYDITPDGKHFVLIRDAAQRTDVGATPIVSPEIRVVLNWFEELKRLVPLH
jgi:serine/threonine-protein kinase